MKRSCRKCGIRVLSPPRFGYFVRKSDKKIIQRFKCRGCGFVFSNATYQKCYRQKKRRINPKVLELLCSSVSQRRSAKLLRVNRKTIARKLIFLAQVCREANLKKFNSRSQIKHFQFDDLETIEHTKCKPLSVTMAVEYKSRKILNFSVSQMPAKGHLAKIAFKKYGFREDKRHIGRERLFSKISHKIHPRALIESDQNPHYISDVKVHFPLAKHLAFEGQRGSVAGQGELKKIRFDPLFYLNHTFAMLRANINRLVRKTWCTTKIPARLEDHIEIYVYYHNEVITKKLLG